MSRKASPPRSLNDGGETDERPTRHEPVTSQLHEAVQGTDEQCMHQDLHLDQEIVRMNEQYKWELENHKISMNLVRDELRRQQEYREVQHGEISVVKALMEQLYGRRRERGRCQIRDLRLQGQVEEDDHHHDTGQQGLQEE